MTLNDIFQVCNSDEVDNKLKDMTAGVKTRSLLQLASAAMWSEFKVRQQDACFYTQLAAGSQGKPVPFWAKPVHVTNQSGAHDALTHLGVLGGPEVDFRRTVGTQQDVVVCALLEVLQFLTERDSTPDSVPSPHRLMAVADGFGVGPKFVRAVWDGYWALAANTWLKMAAANGPEQQLHSGQHAPWIYFNGPMALTGTQAGHEAASEHAFTHKSRIALNSTFADLFLPVFKNGGAIRIEPKSERYAYDLVTLADGLMKRKRDDWPIKWHGGAHTPLLSNSLGLAKSVTPNVPISMPQFSSLRTYGLYGLLRAMEVDACLATSGKTNEWFLEMKKLISAVQKEPAMTQPGKPKYVPIAKEREEALAIVNRSRSATQRLAVAAHPNVVQLTEFAFNTATLECDDDGDYIFLVKDSVYSRFKDWHRGEAAEFMADCNVPAYVALRDRKTDHLRGIAILANGAGWRELDRDCIEFELLPKWPADNRLLELAKQNRSIFSARLLDLSQALGHRHFVMWIEIGGHEIGEGFF